MYRTTNPVCVEIVYGPGQDNTETFYWEPGTVWNGANGPWLVRALLRLVGVGQTLDTFMHDKMYDEAIKARRVADIIFYVMMRWRCVPEWAALIIFAGVRLLGARYYNCK